MFAICPISMVPVRVQASEKSEMLTQLLFGEVVEVISLSPRIAQLTKGWLQVCCPWDNCVGWVERSQLQLLSEDYAHDPGQIFPMSFELLQAAMTDSYSVPITLGATLPHYDGIQLKVNNTRFTFSGQVIDLQQISPAPDLLIKMARKYLYAPYLWGGRSPFGIDSAGLVQMCFKALNINMHRFAREQSEQGRTIDFVQQAQPGDLAFFDNNSGNIIHVGILLADSMILHSYGKVKIDYLDHFGIFDVVEQKYTHKLRIVKRLLDDVPTAQFGLTVNIDELLKETEPELSLF